MAAETCGGSPNVSKTGLKMAPPPNPNAPARKPPISPRVRTWARDLVLNLMSLSAKLRFPYLIFNPCYQVKSLTAIAAQMKHKAIKLLQRAQYYHVQISTPIGDFLDFVGSKMFIAISPRRSTLLIASFAH